MKRTALLRKTPLKRKARLLRRSQKNSRKRAYRAHIKSPEWQRTRRLVLDRDEHRCRTCGSETDLSVHHVHYRTFGHEDGSELVTLCTDHHQVEHALGLLEREGWWEGKLKPVRPAS